MNNKKITKTGNKKISEDAVRKVQLKDILINIYNNIEKVFNLKDIFEIIMHELSEEFIINRGMLVLFKKNSNNQLSIFTGYNLSEEEISRGVYRVGEGIIGKVVEEGKPISIPDINKDKYFLNRMKIKRDENIPVSFIAVPILISGVVSGVLAIEKKFENNDVLNYEKDIIFLIGRIIENKVRLYNKKTERRLDFFDKSIIGQNENNKIHKINDLVGKSEVMQNVFDKINSFAESNISLLLSGENGTGKELIAKTIHINSLRKDNSFVTLACSTIPKKMIETELFGYSKNYFNWAAGDKKGKLQLAYGGTLYIDEINRMPLYLQAKLIKSIQEKEFEPMGSNLKIKSDVRIIMSVNYKTENLLLDTNILDDLYFNVTEIKIPSLKERKEDIPYLIKYFIDKYALINNNNVSGIEREALKYLIDYRWTGNITELENIIERSVILSKSKNIEINDLPIFVNNNENDKSEELNLTKYIENFIKKSYSNGNLYHSFLNLFEKELINKTLIFNKRNKLKTAETLGINRNTLRTKIQQYNII